MKRLFARRPPLDPAKVALCGLVAPLEKGKSSPASLTPQIPAN
eukprot:CAMPEP_0170330898 /NCGR_PEP_ID=MMETSP0116_2-20130129/66403_1 /TAXON_ID=400756 /ORGANISM="Durinskia baltica, Strain CSIRO CS-38" /LENGTH=42 /DNA_ID= /DNA_START= /DNA_END= /DNA_ORIENTATION=